jgi:hypothetical protein
LRQEIQDGLGCPFHRTSFAPETTSPKRKNTVNLQRKCREINDPFVYPVAHNGLAAGLSPAEPTNEIRDYQVSFRIAAAEAPGFPYACHAWQQPD